jgi:hypothetical protein
MELEQGMANVERKQHFECIGTAALVLPGVMVCQDLKV